MARFAAAGLAVRAHRRRGRPRGQALPPRLPRLRARRLPAARREASPSRCSTRSRARGPATVIGSGAKLDVVSAALANALMVRVMDYNDIYWKQDPSHPSDILPAALAAAERMGTGGRELIVGIILGHEFEMRLCEAALPGHPRARLAPRDADRVRLADRRRAGMLRLSLGADPARDRHLGLAPRHARRGHRRQADHDEEHRRPHGHPGRRVRRAARREGLHRPRARHRRQGGARQAASAPSGSSTCSPTASATTWRIEHCGMKAFPTEALTHTPISAVLQIVQEHDLAPEQVAKVHIRSLARAADILADPSKYDPRSQGDRRPLPALRDRRGDRATARSRPASSSRTPSWTTVCAPSCPRSWWWPIPRSRPCSPSCSAWP